MSLEENLDNAVTQQENSENVSGENNNEELDLSLITAPSEEEVASDESADRARRMGWVDKEKFRGNPDDWVDAERFVAVAQEKVPVLRENFKRLEQKNITLEKQIQNLQKSHFDSIKQERARVIQEIEDKKELAVEDGDADMYRKLQERQKEVQKDIEEKDAAQAANSQAPIKEEEMQTINDWRKDNSWFDTDPDMKLVATRRHDEILRTQPYLSLEDNLAEVTKYISSKFLKKEAPNQKRFLSRVEGGGNSLASGNTPTSKSFQDLPEAAKAVAMNFEKGGSMTKEDYVKNYFNQ